jgi:hypothetical protein
LGSKRSPSLRGCSNGGVSFNINKEPNGSLRIYSGG